MSEQERFTGHVCWFDAKKGFGFVTPDEGNQDVFVHWSNIDSEGFKTLKPDQRVSYALGKNHAGSQCVEVLVLEEPEED